jgi:threonine dehydratase
MLSLTPSPDAIRRAHERIAPWIRRTPLMRGEGAAFGAKELVLKLELHQHAGSFKTRGAYNHLLSRAVPASGVTAASGGNHGVAVALAARRLGHPARVFVPEISSPVKVAAIRAQGADVVVGGARYADAQAACDAYANASGALLIHPFDAVETLEGTGTVALEWEEDATRLGLPAIDTVLVAAGGGGLVAGMAAYWLRRVRVVAVEPEGSCCLRAALEAGHPVDVTVESVAADSLGARRTGDLVFAVAREAVDRVVLVPDDAITLAQRTLWSDYRIASEPGGAAAFGALVSGRYLPEAGERVGVLVCGGNVDPKLL